MNTLLLASLFNKGSSELSEHYIREWGSFMRLPAGGWGKRWTLKQIVAA